MSPRTVERKVNAPTRWRRFALAAALSALVVPENSSIAPKPPSGRPSVRLPTSRKKLVRRSDRS
jgi:hypothetical protein